MDMGDLDPRLDACDGGFLVLRQLAASPEPGGPRYRPASRQDRNNTGASDRLSISIRHAPSPFSAARSLGQALPPSAKTRAARAALYGSSAAPGALRAGGMHHGAGHHTEGVNHDMALAALVQFSVRSG
jgi:hypothetical protein